MKVRWVCVDSSRNADGKIELRVRLGPMGGGTRETFNVMLDDGDVGCLLYHLRKVAQERADQLAALKAVLR